MASHSINLHVVLITVRVRPLAAATIKLFQVLVRLLFEFFDFLLNKFLKIVRPIFESGYNMCAATSRARTVLLFSFYF